MGETVAAVTTGLTWELTPEGLIGAPLGEKLLTKLGLIEEGEGLTDVDGKLVTGTWPSELAGEDKLPTKFGLTNEGGTTRGWLKRTPFEEKL